MQCVFMQSLGIYELENILDNLPPLSLREEALVTLVAGSENQFCRVWSAAAPRFAVAQLLSRF